MILSITIDIMLVHFLFALDGDTVELFGFLVTVGVVVYDDITVDTALLLPRQCLTIDDHQPHRQPRSLGHTNAFSHKL